MARMPRAVIPGVPHHITQRGIARQAVFSSDHDRRIYLRLLRENAVQSGLEILGYCLMTNHVHLVAIPERDCTLQLVLGRTHGRYAQYANAQLAQQGHFWKNRFFSCALDESHLWVALRYIERNPVRAGMVAKPADWPWSSARAHGRPEVGDSLLSLSLWQNRFNADEWSVLLETDTLSEAELRLRMNTYNGRPLGTPAFVKDMELRVGRPLAPRKGGRPKKQTMSATVGV